MSSVGKAIGKVVGGITGSNQAASGAQDAAQTQAASSQAAIDEQKRQFDKLVELMKPYVTAGTGSIKAQQDILGINGSAAQQAAVSSIEKSPYFQSVAKQGENAILQNASATGGLRGGNTQSALAQYRPALLNSLVQQQYSNLGGLTQIGQAAAAGQAAAGQSSANSIGSLLQNQGAALAGGQIAAGNATQNAISSGLGLAAGIGGFFF